MKNSFLNLLARSSLDTDTNPDWDEWLQEETSRHSSTGSPGSVSTPENLPVEFFHQPASFSSEVYSHPGSFPSKLYQHYPQPQLQDHHHQNGRINYQFATNFPPYYHPVTGHEVMHPGYQSPLSMLSSSDCQDGDTKSPLYYHQLQTPDQMRLFSISNADTFSRRDGQEYNPSNCVNSTYSTLLHPRVSVSTCSLSSFSQTADEMKMPALTKNSDQGHRKTVLCNKTIEKRSNDDSEPKHVSEGKIPQCVSPTSCSNCGTSSTSLWRRDSSGKSG